jgi:hypothetical protein
MSINQIVEDRFKPWLNARVNNLIVDGDLTVEGDIIRPGSTVVAGTYGSSTEVPVVTVDSSGNILDIQEVAIGGSVDSVTEVYLKPVGEAAFVVDVDLLPEMVPALNSWYSAQFITFLRRGDSTIARKNIADALFRLNAGVVVDIRVAPYTINYPDNNPITSMTFDLTYSSPGGLTIRANVTNVSDAANAGVATLVVSDVQRLG